MDAKRNKSYDGRTIDAGTKGEAVPSAEGAECLRFFDKRKMFLDALLDVLDEKPLDKVRPSDLCERCGASRSTFYRYFGSVEDIPMWYRDYGAEIGMYQIGRRYTATQGHLISVQLLADCSKIYRYYASSPRTLNAEFAYVAAQSHVQAMRAVLEERGQRIDKKRAYELESLAWGCCIAVSSWINNGMDLPVRDIVDVIVGLYPPALLAIFDSPSDPVPAIDVVRELLGT